MIWTLYDPLDKRGHQNRKRGAREAGSKKKFQKFVPTTAEHVLLLLKSGSNLQSPPPFVP